MEMQLFDDESAQGALMDENAAKDARIAELEKWLSRSLGDYPCEHLPEDDVTMYPACSYCKMQVEAMKALQPKDEA